MTEKAKILLNALENAKKELATNKEEQETEKRELEALKSLTYDTLGLIKEDIENNPEKYKEGLSFGDKSGLTLGEYVALVDNAINGESTAIKELKEMAEANPDINIQQHIEERRAIIADHKATNKEAIKILSSGKLKETETLLGGATEADFEAAGVTIKNLPRKKSEKLEAIYNIAFTDLLKLWQYLSKKKESSNAAGVGLQPLPYNNKQPEKTAISNSLVANKLIEIEQATKANGGGATVRADKGGNGSFKVITSLQYDDDNISITGRPLTSFDKLVHNAIASIYEAGNAYFSLQTLYRAIHGLDGSETIKADTLEPLKQSVSTGIVKRLKIDATAQIEAYYKGKVKKVVYENYFLPLKKITITMSNGEILDGYEFLDVPPLYQYSKNLNQVISVPIKLLDTREYVKNSPEVATMREYLIKRIEGMKNTKNSLKNNNILYDSIFKELGLNIEDLNRAQQKRKRDYIKKILDSFIAKGYIENYTEYKEGQSIKGLTINF